MAFDLAISPNGDLILSAAKDLQGATGIAIIQQRILMRLRLTRGSWIYDPGGRLGSDLAELFGLEPEIAAQRVVPLTREALRSMEDIEVTDVIAQPGVRDITVIVYYKLIFKDEDEGFSEFTEVQTVGATIPLAD